MKTTNEISITNFDAWSGGEDTQQTIIDEGKEDDFDMLIEELYPDGIDEGHLNDLLRFEEDWIFEMLNIDTDD